LIGIYQCKEKYTITLKLKKKDVEKKMVGYWVSTPQKKSC